MSDDEDILKNARRHFGKPPDYPPCSPGEEVAYEVKFGKQETPGLLPPDMLAIGEEIAAVDRRITELEGLKIQLQMRFEKLERQRQGVPPPEPGDGWT